jgi:hypothetical protein
MQCDAHVRIVIFLQLQSEELPVPDEQIYQSALGAGPNGSRNTQLTSG